MTETDNNRLYLKQNKGASLSVASGAAFFVIFFTCVTLATLSFTASQDFVSNLIQQKYSKIAQNNVEMLTRALDHLENTLLLAGQTYTSSSTAKVVFPDFDQIVLALPDANQKWAYKILQNRNLSSGKGKSYEIQDYRQISSFLSHVQTSINISTQIFTDPSVFILKTQDFRVSHQAPPFGLVIKTDNNRILIATAHIDNVFSEYWLHDNEIAKISIKESEGGDFEMYQFDSQIEESEKIDFIPIYEFSFAGRSWEVQTEFRKQSYIYWLENIPLFLIGFWIFAGLFSVLLLQKIQNLYSRSHDLMAEVETQKEKVAREMAANETLNKSLRAAKQDRKTIIDSVSDIIFETDFSGKLSFLNAAWTKITGFDVEQSLGVEFFKMLHPQEQEEHKRDFQLLVNGKKSGYRMFTRLRTSDGTFRAVEMAIEVIRQDENKNLRVVGTMTDVEERERAEKALMEAEKKYRAIVENAASGIFQLTPEGVYLSANPSMARLLGYTAPEELLRKVKNAHETIYVDGKKHQETLNELEAFGVLNNFETRIRQRDGTIIWINENVRTVKDEAGNTLYYEGSMDDITQRKEGDLALREAKMHSDMANRAKSEFLANMGHELRTPLNAIIGFSEIIKNEVLGKIEQESYKEYAIDIHKSGRHLLNIINEILDISRIESNQRQLNEEMVDIAEIVSSSLDLMKNKIARGKLKVTNKVVDLPDIIGEEIAIKQAVINILSNAVKFTPQTGSITITGDIDAQKALRLSITDTGIGLDEDEIQKALSPFGQIDNALNRSNKGTGLGLTLVNSLMKLHGGSLEIVSQKGIGTTVTLIFPASRLAQNEAKVKS